MHRRRVQHLKLHNLTGGVWIVRIAIREWLIGSVLKNDFCSRSQAANISRPKILLRFFIDFPPCGKRWKGLPCKKMRGENRTRGSIFWDFGRWLGKPETG